MKALAKEKLASGIKKKKKNCCMCAVTVAKHVVVWAVFLKAFLARHASMMAYQQ